MFFTVIEPSEQKPDGEWNPAFPEYNTIETRIESFKPWPLPIKDMAKAGFFNSGRYFSIYIMHCKCNNDNSPEKVK